MIKVTASTVLAALLAMTMASHVQAEAPPATVDTAEVIPAPSSPVEDNGATPAHEPSLEPGLDRERAGHRAQTLEERRLEEEERRKGAGLDRERARQRAEKLEERRE